MQRPTDTVGACSGPRISEFASGLQQPLGRSSSTSSSNVGEVNLVEAASQDHSRLPLLVHCTKRVAAPGLIVPCAGCDGHGLSL
eukprot:2683482-Rhodomonas_salina.1